MRIALLLIINLVISPIVAFFVNLGLGILIFAVTHAVITFIPFRPRMGEYVLHTKIKPETQDRLSSVSSKLHYKMYWIIMNGGLFVLSYIAFIQPDQPILKI